MIVAKRGHAVVLDDSHILTVQHVALGSDTMYIHDRRGKNKLAKVLMHIPAYPESLVILEVADGGMGGGAKFRPGGVAIFDPESGPGDSGSAVFDTKGRVVGLHYGRTKEGDPVMVAIPGWFTWPMSNAQK